MIGTRPAASRLGASARELQREGHEREAGEEQPGVGRQVDVDGRALAVDDPPGEHGEVHRDEHQEQERALLPVECEPLGRVALDGENEEADQDEDRHEDGPVDDATADGDQLPAPLAAVVDRGAAPAPTRLSGFVRIA